MPLIPNDIEMYLAEDSNPEPRRNKKQLQPSPILILISDRNIFPPRQFSSFSAKLRKIEIPDNGRVLISSWSKKDKLISLCQTRPSRVVRFRYKIILSTAIKRTVLKLIFKTIGGLRYHPSASVSLDQNRLINIFEKWSFSKMLLLLENCRHLRHKGLKMNLMEQNHHQPSMTIGQQRKIICEVGPNNSGWLSIGQFYDSATQ